MPRVKVCGFTHEADVAKAVEAGVDAVGAIVDVPVETPREVSASRAAALFGTVPPFVSTVLVTMADSREAVRSLVERVEPDAVQVHAGLAPEDVGALSADGMTTIAAVDHDDAEVAAYAAKADAVLVDSMDAAGAGGTGTTHDWEQTRSLDTLEAPLILAGGLTPENVADAVRTVDPYAVDVASGVEVEPGRKDAASIEQFVAQATGRVAQ